MDTTTPPPTDVAMNLGLYQVCQLLAQASQKQRDLDSLDTGYTVLNQEIEELKFQVAQLLHQELGHYADYLAIGWSKYLRSYGIHPLG